MFHMPFCHCETWVQVLCHYLPIEIRTPFEETLSDSFYEGGDFGIAQQLVCKFDGVSTGLHGVHEYNQFSWLWECFVTWW
jgi:hypothetical protein